VLRIALDRVRELGCRTNEVERVHADGMTRGLHRGAATRRLEHAQLRLQLRDVTAERVEGVAGALGIEPVAGARDVLELWQARKRRGCCPARAFGCHLGRASLYA